MPTDDSPTRLVHLITSLEGGGTENFLYQVIAGSPKKYLHRVYYLGHDGVTGERLRRLGIPVGKTNPLALLKTLRQENPDVLHTCLHWAHQVGRVIGRMAKIPFILSSHRSIDIWQKPWHRAMDRWTLPFCHAVAVNSEAAWRVVEEKIRSATKRPRLFKVANGLDFASFKAQDRNLAWARYNLPPEAMAGGTLMRLHPEKGAEKIPAFANALLNKHPNLYLLIGGSGPMETALKKQTASWGNRIRWVGWQEDTLPFLSSLDFFWLLSREESFSQALLEASGVGLPWLAPDVGGVRELLEAGACGLMLPSHELSAAVSNAEKLLADRETYHTKAREAIPQLRNRYDLPAMVGAFYNIVESRGG